ncbi:amino acid kinase family protein [Phyllobacterium sp. K27]
MKPVIVKLGGSTAGETQMQHWIDAIANAAFPVVIVPGGGPFADQVRISQRRLDYSDQAAHAMAILAMDQFGIAIAERHPDLRMARTVHEIKALLDRGHTPVWLPSAMTIGAADIPCSWDITSDSLSAWLAGVLSADDMLLVKQTDEYQHYSTVEELAAAGIVDGMLTAMLTGDIRVHIAGPQILNWLDLPLTRIPSSLILQDRQIEAMSVR